MSDFPCPFCKATLAVDLTPAEVTPAKLVAEVVTVKPAALVPETVTPASVTGLRLVAPPVVVEPPPPPPPPPPDPVPVPPPPTTGTVKVYSGAQANAIDTRSAPMPDGSTLDATTATWTGQTKYVANWYGKGHGLWKGGTMTGTWNQATTSWDGGYHSFTGLIAGWEYPTVDGLRVHNYGDPVRFNEPIVKAWVQRYCWYSDMHDDGLGENDRQKNGLIEYCLADGVYVGYSQRRGSDWTDNGEANTVTMRGTLVRLKPFALTATTPNTSGGFFKMDSRTPASNPRLVLEDCVFRADGQPGTGSLELNPHGKVTARNCWIVWLGAGAYPAVIPPGWTLTRDVGVWENAVAALKARPDWKARH